MRGRQPQSAVLFGPSRRVALVSSTPTTYTLSQRPQKSIQAQLRQSNGYLPRRPAQYRSAHAVLVRHRMPRHTRSHTHEDRQHPAELPAHTRPRGPWRTHTSTHTPTPLLSVYIEASQSMQARINCRQKGHGGLHWPGSGHARPSYICCHRLLKKPHRLRTKSARQGIQQVRHCCRSLVAAFGQGKCRWRGGTGPDSVKKVRQLGSKKQVCSATNDRASWVQM
jgi:hypothetical protein